MSAAPPFVGSLGIVHRGHEDQTQWLTIWDATRGAYRFIEARRQGSETFRSCLIDAIEDELNFDAADYLLSDYSLAHHQAPIEWPGAAKPAWVVVEFFRITLYGKSAESKLKHGGDIRWWSLPDIARGFGEDGVTLCDRQHLLLVRADVLPRWATGNAQRD